MRNMLVWVVLAICTSGCGASAGVSGGYYATGPRPVYYQSPPPVAVVYESPRYMARPVYERPVVREVIVERSATHVTTVVRQQGKRRRGHLAFA